MFYGGMYSYLYMRPANNTEPDYVIKQRIYDEHLSREKVLFVLDDRKQVVDMWRSNGLTVLQCADGNF
jgi:chromosome condensin MukBEF MukE localization factor